MLLSHLKLYTPHLHKDDRNLLATNSGYAVAHIQVRSSTTLYIADVSRMKKVSPLVTPVSLCMRPHCCRGLHASIGSAETMHVVEYCLNDGSHLVKEPLAEDTRGDNYSNMAKNSNCENEREIERRRKIGLANKGKVPWNKGRKHSAETREIIRQKTIQALRDPKVRKKMSECPRSRSNQTKARIRMSLRKLWGQRLNWKRSREKFFQLWAESIARAAKTGGSDQQELEWDSYEKMKRDIALQQLEWAAQMAREKQIARVLAAKRREERKKELAQEKMKREEKKKVRGESKTKARKKSKEEKEELAVNQEFKLKEKLMKIHKQKSTISHVSSQHRRTWENLDMKFKRSEQNQVTLADQIRLAKVRRAESVIQETLTIFSGFPSSKRLGEEALDPNKLLLVEQCMNAEPE